MTVISLLLQLLTVVPVAGAYAMQRGPNIDVSVTYTDELPVNVCVASFHTDDEDLQYPVDTHCWKPKNPVCEFDLWKDERLDMVNFRVTIRYASGKEDKIELVWRINT